MKGIGEREGAQPVSSSGRKILDEMMDEGLGDHILLLRLYQVSKNIADWPYIGSRLVGAAFV